MSVAIVHDYVTQRGGAERVLLSMLKAYPAAPLYTSLYSPKSTFPEFQGRTITTSRLNQLPFLRAHHRLAFPVLAPAVSRLHVPANVVLCSSSGWAHGVSSEGKKVVFCHAPARWLYQPDAYLGSRRPLARSVLGAFRSRLARWDRRAAGSAHRYLANSTIVRSQILEHYGIEAEVVPPPHSIDPRGEATPIAAVDAGFFLCVSRLLPYKHVDAAIEAFRGLRGQRLIVVGSGPQERRLRATAPPNVLLLGSVSDTQLRWLYANTAGLVAASFEDYGLTPLEAAAFGKPTAALRWGGYLDTVRAGETGVFFDRPEPASIRRAVLELAQAAFPEVRLRAHADAFSEERFIQRLRALVEESGQ
jgi:glycosyltransferase involved in cell wall biosynthesis